MARSIGEFRNFVLSKYPKMSKTQLQQLDDFVGQKQAEQALQAGGITLQDIPIEKRAGVASSLISKGVNVKAKQSAEEVKKEQANTASVALLNQLEREYTEAGGGTFGVGPGARIKGSAASLGAKAGLNDPANVYIRSKAGFAATLKQLTGDVGVLTDKDYARLAGLLPDFGSTKGESVKFFNNLREQLAAKFGGEKTETTFKPIRENQRGPIASLTDVLFPSATTYAEKGFKGELSAQKRPMSLTDILASGAGPLGVAATRPDIAGETLPTAIESAIGVKGLQGLGTLKGGLSKIFNIKGALGQARKEAAAGTAIKISTQPIVEAGKKYISNDPEAKSFLKTILKPLGKQKDLAPVDLLDKIGIWNKAYTAAGKVGSSAKAGFYDALAKAAKAQIKEKAPEVAKYTKLLDLTYKGPKAAQKASWLALKAVGLGKLLGL